MGMRYSLISRDWIADCVEIMHEGYMADACITLGACDKTVPGAVMPLARCDTSGVFIYGGPLVPGMCNPPLRPDAPPQYHRVFLAWAWFRPFPSGGLCATWPTVYQSHSRARTILATILLSRIN